MNQKFERTENNFYIGVKRVHAYQMTRAEYNDLRGWELPGDENGSDDGYLVEYVDGGKPNTTMFNGYISWSPADVFKKSYGQTNGLDFSSALLGMKIGLMAYREGWNGKDLLVGMHRPTEDELCSLPYLYIKYPDDEYGTLGEIAPWLASQTDLLADDWVIAVVIS